MRESMFRGKRVGGGEWVYGDLLHDKDGRPHIVPKGQEFDFDDDMFEIYEVEPATVGQYTGLKDKNGREIWEGDIFKHTDSNGVCIVRVLWDGCNARFIGIDQRNRLWYVGREPRITVVGNIHDNPELLK